MGTDTCPFAPAMPNGISGPTGRRVRMINHLAIRDMTYSQLSTRTISRVVWSCGRRLRTHHASPRSAARHCSHPLSDTAGERQKPRAWPRSQVVGLFGFTRFGGRQPTWPISHDSGWCYTCKCLRGQASTLAEKFSCALDNPRVGMKSQNSSWDELSGASTPADRCRSTADRPILRCSGPQRFREIRSPNKSALASMSHRCRWARGPIPVTEPLSARRLYGCTPINPQQRHASPAVH